MKVGTLRDKLAEFGDDLDIPELLDVHLVEDAIAGRRVGLALLKTEIDRRDAAPMLGGGVTEQEPPLDFDVDDDSGVDMTADPDADPAGEDSDR